MNGKEAVIGTVLMLIGQNSRTVAEDVSAKIAQVSKTLPPGVEVKVVLDRAELVNATVGTVEKNLTEGALRSEENTSELQSLMRISYAVICLKKKNKKHNKQETHA